MTFRRILVTVDHDPIAAHAADVGIELARSVGVEADLVVIGSHSRRGLTRAVLGSVAEAVMRHAPCPVLVVRAKE